MRYQKTPLTENVNITIDWVESLQAFSADYHIHIQTLSEELLELIETGMTSKTWKLSLKVENTQKSKLVPLLIQIK